MGQFTALLYKETVQSKSRYFSYCCTMITPSVAILLLAYARSLVDSFNIKDLLVKDDIVIPASFMVCNLINYGNAEAFEDIKAFFLITNPVRIVRYALAEKEKAEDIQDFFSTVPLFFGYTAYNQTSMPRFAFDNAPSNQDFNQRLVDKMIEQMKTPMPWWRRLNPDASVWFDKFDQEFGFNATIQQNNPINPRYIRNNGYNLAYTRMNTMGSYRMTRLHNEGYISTMNMLNNKFLINQITRPLPLPLILAVVSPTYDSSYFYQFLEAAYATVGVTLFPVSMSLGFPIALMAIVVDKVRKVRAVLDVNGLRPINYWLSYLAFFMIMLSISNGLFFYFAYSQVPIEFFQKTTGWALFWLSTGWNLGQVTFAFLLSTFLSSTASAAFIGYICSTILMVLSSAVSIFVLQIPTPMPSLLMAFPHAAAVRGYYSIFFSCLGSKCPGSLADLGAETVRSLFWLYGSSFVFFVLTVILNEPAIRKSFFGLLSRIKSRFVMAPQALNMAVEKDASVVEFEKTAVDLDLDESQPPLLVRNVSKTYHEGKKVTKAVGNVSLYLKEDSIFGLLGPNGAGKTTLLSIIGGITQPTSGEVFIEGKKAILGKRTHIGYCPQFDILFDDLTVEEHMVFFSLFKGSPISGMNRRVKDAIERVDLMEKRKNKVKTLSGGMRRRCSLAIALVGDSKLILLDEPSSGLDPKQRRIFWKTIKAATRDKAVILTTHLMEEADVLSDDVAIIVDGDLRAYGSPAYLKTLHSAGSKLQLLWALNTSTEDREALIDSLLDICPGFKQVRCFENIYEYAVPDTVAGSNYGLFFTILEAARPKLVQEWSISKNNLEEVFLSVLDKYSARPALSPAHSLPGSLREESFSELVSLVDISAASSAN